MKEFYAEIDDWLATHKDGWASSKKVMALVGAVMALHPDRIVEIGVWAGRSFIPMALALKWLQSSGRIIGIDPWSKNSSVQGLTGEHLDWWDKVDHDRIYKQFCDQISATGVGPWIEVFRCRSDEYKLKPDLVIDILHVDGCHGDVASIFDVQHFGPQVRPGGLLFMDDVNWAAKATAMLPELGFKSLYTLDTGVMFQRVKI